MTAFLQVKDNAHTRSPADALNNTEANLVINGLDTTRFPIVEVGFAVTIWDDVTYPDPGDDPNMERCFVSAAEIASSGSMTLFRQNPIAHPGAPKIAILMLAQHVSMLNEAVNELETEMLNKADQGHTHTATEVGALPADTELQNMVANADMVLSGHRITMLGDGVESTDAATVGQVNTAVASLVNSAPATLDTLKEFADALGNDPNFATTLTTLIGTKESAVTAGTTAQYYRGDKTWQTLNKSAVGLSNVDNTSDIDKPVSTAQAAADALALPKAGGTMTGALTIQRNGARADIINTEAAQHATASFKAYSNQPTMGNYAGVQIGSSINDAGITQSKFFIDRISNTGVFQSTLFSININSGVSTFNGTVAPGTNTSYNLGNSSLYWSNLYAQTLNLNSTASISGATAGALGITGQVGIGTNSPTHSLTLATGNSLSMYNTTDQTTNYERMVMNWSGNVYQIFTLAGGTGAARNIRIGDSGGYLDFAPAASGGAPKFSYTRTSNTSGSLFNITTTGASLTAGSGLQYGLSINPTIAQTSTAAYTMLLINPTETTIGSGSKLLIDAQVGGSSKFKVENTGFFTSASGGTLGGTLFTRSISMTDANNIAVGTNVGTKIGTATNQKIGFFNATPIVQPSATPADATDLATALTLVNDLKAKLLSLGLAA